MTDPNDNAALLALADGMERHAERLVPSEGGNMLSYYAKRLRAIATERQAKDERSENTRPAVDTPDGGAKHVGWFNEIGGKLCYLHGTFDPREVHDNGKPYLKAYTYTAGLNAVATRAEVEAALAAAGVGGVDQQALREVRDAANEVLRISDRDHVAWHRLREALAALTPGAARDGGEVVA